MMNKSPVPFSIITGNTIFRLVQEDLGGCIDVVRNAYLAHAKGSSINPHGVFLRFPDRTNARIIALPSHLSSPWNMSGLKWVASYPDNVGCGLPRASAVLLLNSHNDGYPLACLEGSVISAARTAASAVLAASHLREGNHRVRAFGIVGTGLIARYIYHFLVGTGWEIGAVYLYDINRDRALHFGANLHRPENQPAVASNDLSSLLRTCDLLLFSTVAARPHVHDPTFFAHNPVILNISLRDLAPEVLLSACNVVDDIDHVMQADTAPHLTEQRSGSRDFVAGTLAEVIAKQCVIDHSRPIIFSPFGLGLLDLAVGKWVYDRAVASGENHVINDFFCDSPF